MGDGDELRQLLDTLSRLRTQGELRPILVEGKKDEAALRALGFREMILRLNKGLSLLTFCEELKIHHDSVIILFDWDRTGSKLTRLVSGYLESLCMNYDTRFRKELEGLCKTRVKDVEGILPYIYDLLEDMKLPCPVEDLISSYEQGLVLA